MKRKINRVRRKIAFKIGLDWHMPALGYLIDYNRDRFSPNYPY